jgi:hypothetical protein
MAAPNIVNVSSIFGKSKGKAITTSLEDVITCGAEKVLKVNAIYVANIDGTDNVEVDVGFYDASEATTFYLIKTMVVPADATIDVLSSSIYLEEGDKIQVLAGAASDAQIVVSYEELDDA